jgi:murein DD-endopeptidase MepM/ murein hydrolase activator NlpD
MNLIIFSKRHGQARDVNLGHPLIIGCAALALLVVLGGAFTAGMTFGRSRRESLALGQATRWMDILGHQRQQIADLEQQSQARSNAFAIQLGDIEAHVMRIDALGKRLTTMAGIKSSEFNFGQNPPQGGPETDIPGTAPAMAGISAMLKSLAGEIDQRAAQLSALENVILTRQLRQEIHPEGRPVSTGYISSPFGERIDPFTGGDEFHEGIDFAAPMGTPIHAVAAGVVTWAGPRGGYGNLVQIDHGDGYATRYGHSEKILVHVGETVQRGDVIALVGDTGRSTGPHVHFEVLFHGHEINPAAFIRLHAKSAILRTATAAATPLASGLAR